MTIQFQRRARLVLGAVEILSEGESGLRIDFRISRSVKAESNSATISVFNLSRDTRSKLDLQTDRIILEAGYEGDAPAIFCGDRGLVQHAHEGTEWRTKVEAKDGHKLLRRLIKLSLDGPVTGDAVLSAILSAAGLSLDSVTMDADATAALLGLQLAGGFRHHGSIRAAFRRLAVAAGLIWSSQNCKPQILSKGGGTLEQVYRLNPESGLIGSPVRVVDPKRPKLKAWRGECLLNGRLYPGRRVLVESEAVTTALKLTQANHNGSTHGADRSWITQWEGTEI